MILFRYRLCDMALLWTLISSFAYYVVSPFTDDIRIFFSAAVNADQYGIEGAWEVKPIGNRILFYAMWKAAGWIDPVYFPLLCKLIVGAVIIVVCWYFSKKIHESIGTDQFTIFSIASTGLFLQSTFCIFQPEWFAVIGSLLALALLLDEDHYLPVGLFLLTAIALLKSSTALMILSILVAWFAIKKDKSRDIKGCDIISVICGFGIGSALSIYLFPSIFPDTNLAIALVNSNQTHLSQGILSMYFDFVRFFPLGDILLLTAITISATILIALNYRSSWWKDSRIHKKWLWIVFMWTFPAIIVLSTREFFAYHYSVLVFPAIITTSLLLSENLEFKIEIFTVSMVFCMIVAMFTFVSVTGDDHPYQTFLGSLQSDANEIQKLIKDEPEVLYLDYGEAQYYLRKPSACRYTYPLPLQRGVEGTAANEIIRCIESYQGNYVIMQPWSRELKMNETVKNYLGNLTLVHDGAWQVYQRSD